MRALIFVGVYVLMCAFGDEAIAWLDARYVETAIYQALAPVIGWIVIVGLVGFLALLVVGAVEPRRGVAPHEDDATLAARQLPQR